MTLETTTTIQKLTGQDMDYFVDVLRLFERVFEMQEFQLPELTHLKEVLEKEDFMVFVALRQKEVIGALTAYKLATYYSPRPLAYIYDLAVALPYQRQGVGQSLIAAFNDYCYQLGFQEVFVQADRVDGYALDFYRSTRPTAEEDVIHFTYSLPAFTER